MSQIPRRAVLSAAAILAVASAPADAQIVVEGYGGAAGPVTQVAPSVSAPAPADAPAPDAAPEQEDAQGVADSSATVPGSEAGRATAVPGATATPAVAVATETGSGLPFTGGEALLLAALGLGLVALGAGVRRASAG